MLLYIIINIPYSSHLPILSITVYQIVGTCPYVTLLIRHMA